MLPVYSVWNYIAGGHEQKEGYYVLVSCRSAKWWNLAFSSAGDITKQYGWLGQIHARSETLLSEASNCSSQRIQLHTVSYTDMLYSVKQASRNVNRYVSLSIYGRMMMMNDKRCNCASGTVFRHDVRRRVDVGDDERRPDVVSAGHAQRRRRGSALRRRPHPLHSVVIATTPVSAAVQSFYGAAEILGKRGRKLKAAHEWKCVLHTVAVKQINKLIQRLWSNR